MLNIILRFIFAASAGALVWNLIGAFQNDGIPFNPVRERKLWNGVGFGCIMILVLILNDVLNY